MTMTTWQTPSRDFERIILMGIQGVGKSVGILQIARHISGTMYYIDNDNTTGRLLETEFPDLKVREEYRGGEEDDRFTDPDGKLVIYHCKGWEENLWAINEIRSQAGPNDWIAIDSLTALWVDVAGYYTNEIFGDNVSGYFMKVRQQRQEAKEAQEKAKELAARGSKKKVKAPKVGGGMLEGWQDYGVINPLFKENVRDLLQVPPCNLIATTEINVLSTEDKKDRDLAELYGGFGARPAGQKRTGHDVHTIIWLKKSRDGTYTMTTVKDRGREDMVDEEVDNLAEDYLRDVAGWKPKVRKKKGKVKVKAKTTTAREE